MFTVCQRYLLFRVWFHPKIEMKTFSLRETFFECPYIQFDSRACNASFISVNTWGKHDSSHGVFRYLLLFATQSISGTNFVIHSCGCRNGKKNLLIIWTHRILYVSFVRCFFLTASDEGSARCQVFFFVKSKFLLQSSPLCCSDCQITHTSLSGGTLGGLASQKSLRYNHIYNVTEYQDRF